MPTRQWRRISRLRQKQMQKNEELKAIRRILLTPSISNGMDSELGCSSTSDLTKTRIRTLRRMQRACYLPTISTSLHLPRNHIMTCTDKLSFKCNTTWEDTDQHHSNSTVTLKPQRQRSQTSWTWKRIFKFALNSYFDCLTGICMKGSKQCSFLSLGEHKKINGLMLCCWEQQI